MRAVRGGLGPVALLVTGTLACDARPAPPALLLGNFTDDYGSEFSIADTVWRHGAGARYHITRWNPAGQYLVARNDPANPGGGGRWTRIDWMPLEMPPYTWAFCMSAYDAPTADSAEATRIADRSAPRTGCNGFPFTRMAPR